MENYESSSNNLSYLIGLLIVVSFFAFFKLGSFSLQNGIESRNGVNAIEMMTSSDMFHLQYGDKPDNWQVKPPLTIWATGISFNLFGFNEFALRLPMALATIFAFLFLFKTITLYQQADFAFFTCLILLSVKGLVGRHITDLGEYDALLVCFMMMAVYHFLKYLDFKKRKSQFISAIFFGLAFFTKGFGIVPVLVGLVLYTLVRKQFKPILRQISSWESLGLFLIFPLMWLLGMNFNFNQTIFANFQQEVLSYSLQTTDRDVFLFFNYLKIQYQWWDWIFYTSIPVSLYLIYKNLGELNPLDPANISTKRIATTAIKKRGFTLQELLERPELKPNIQLLTFSICIWLGLGLFCTFSKNEQYLAFALPFIAITTASGVYYLNNRYKIASGIFVFALVFTMWHQLEYYLTPSTKPAFIEANKAYIQSTPGIACDADLPPQDIFLYLKFQYPDMPVVDGDSDFADAVFCRSRNAYLYKGFKVISQSERYQILEKEMF